MPRPTLKIVASQRDALYEQVRNHLAGLGDVVVAPERQKDHPLRCGYRGSRRGRGRRAE